MKDLRFLHLEDDPLDGELAEMALRTAGIQVLEAVRREPSLQALPIVVLTSSREEPDLQRCYALGVNAYVVKPVDFADFLKAIGNLGVFWALINQPPPGSIQAKG